MARTSDHAARRAQILAGVHSVARREGLGSVTVARTAEAAEVSVGMVQHYYDTKAALLIDAFDALRVGVLARVDAQILRAEKRGARIEDMLEHSLLQLLPLDARRRDESYLAAAFTGLALEDASLRNHLGAHREELRRRLRTALENAKLCGEAETDLDSDAEAYGALALTEGLATMLLADAGRDRRTWARRSLREATGRLCPGPCSHGRPAR